MIKSGPVLTTPSFLERHTVAGVPEGYIGLFLAKTFEREGRALLYIASDEAKLEEVEEALRFFAPQITTLHFPAWDCLPYDRVSPTAAVTGTRLKTLAQLLTLKGSTPIVVLTTVAAVSQRVIPRAVLQGAAFSIKPGQRLDLNALQSFLANNGYHRADTVRETGEFAVRGGLMDIFPSGVLEPLRIDCFGDEVETIRTFDPLSQRTTGESVECRLYPASEVLLNPDTIREFRMRYRDAFGSVRDEDPLYAAMSAGQKYAGYEHWLPFFYSALDTLFDYVPGALIVLDHQAEPARDAREQQVKELYEARKSFLKSEEKAQKKNLYRPVPWASLFLPSAEWKSALAAHKAIDLSPFLPALNQEDGGARKGKDFSEARTQGGSAVYDTVREHISALSAQNKKVILACYSAGARDRLRAIFEEHGLALSENPDDAVSIVVLGLEQGFETATQAVLTEQDILGDRLARITKKKKKSDAFIFEISQIHEGDYVVHQEHGVGQFLSLETVVVEGIPHDCLKLLYANGDKLFVPVENLDVLSRYGSSENAIVLDKLGSTAWQVRRGKAKRDLFLLANELLKIAAARALQTTDPIFKIGDSYERFCAGFPYPETEDQAKAIEDIAEDLSAGRAMDRLVCGDVGFGKTEVALRAASLASLAGYQVAMVAPTTLLARQHYQTFLKRFQGTSIRIGMLSRFVSTREADKVRAGLASGDVQIAVGTHALLSEKIKFNNLALVIVDEEQKFGVKQKERLKKICENVHVLTLTATPIPRTLQMALTGVRELSLIATAPIDRLAVKTFVLPEDPVVLRDALMREHYRGGQSFYVCPRIADLADLERSLKQIVPELKTVVAHGQMGAEEIEEKMSAFYEGAFDILLSTNIVESGLDIPNANTMIVHRAEMFGLAQLYQLRGRIGRSKQRAYAYLTFDGQKKLTKLAEKRLHAIEQLTTLGAGFQLASHDLDIRGAGNLLGEEQSGHIKEIGVELYQQMLEEAVAAAKSGHTMTDEKWSPTINLGVPVLIPEEYIADIDVRLSVYRRIAALTDRPAIDAFAAEIIDRFGPLPSDVINLLDIVEIKQLCRKAGIERVDAGPKGAVMSFHASTQIQVQKLVQYISRYPGTVKLRPEDQKLVFIKAWDEFPQRLRGLHKILTDLASFLG